MIASAVILSEQVTDPSIQDVALRLRGRGIDPLVVSTRHLHEIPLAISFDARTGETVAELDGVNLASPNTRVWWRRGSRLKAKDIVTETDAGVAAYRSAQYVQALNSLISVSLAAGARWMNNPIREQELDQNKMVQHAIAQRVGLATPTTLCTNDPARVLEFAREFPVLAVKPAAGVAIKTPADNEFGMVPLITLTRRLTAPELVKRLSHVEAAPVIVQPYVEKDFELRATIVGDSVLTAKIDSQASEETRVDWRNYDIPNTPHMRYDLDVDTRERLLAFMRNSGLVFAAVDLVMTPDGEAVFLEANPAGQYGWIETLTGLPITETIASWLSGEDE